MPQRSGWFKINASADTKTAEVLIFGDIGWEVNASEFATSLAELDAEALTVRVNSPGGNVYDGLAIMNALRGHGGTVTAIVEGLAASAASVIAIGGADRVVCRPNAEIMIHEAWTFADGNSDDLKKIVSDLDRVSQNIAKIYADKAGTDADMWRAAMKAETWFSADEALEAGLVDEVADARESKNALAGSFQMSAFKHAGRAAAPAPRIAHPGHNQEEENMAFLNAVAQKLGVKATDLTETQVLAALEEAFNKQAANELAVTYSDTEVAAGDEATVKPEGAPEGAEFALADDAPEWASVDAGSGELTLAPGDDVAAAEVSVKVDVTAEDETATAAVKVTVTAAAGDEGEGESGSDSGSGSDGASNSVKTVTLDEATYRDLVDAAELGWKAKLANEAKGRADEVDKWISEGRVNAARRSQVLSHMNSDPEGARALYGEIPKNTIPRAELGYGVGGEDGEPSGSSDTNKSRSEFPTARY